MRYYLDTNILVFLITGQKDEIDPDVKEHIFDYANRMMTSSVCVHELMHLYQIGKLPFKKGAHPPLPPDVLSWLEDIGPGLADGGKDFACYPLAEGFGLRFAAVEYYVIQAVFIDECRFLLSSKGIRDDLI